jgi:non-specific serine/threonine protein kinase
LYKDLEFPANPPSVKSLAIQDKYLFVVKRDQLEENKIRQLLQNRGLFYIQHRWQIDPQFKILDWLRTQIPTLQKEGIEFFGEQKLSRYQLRRGIPSLKVKITSGLDWLDIQFKFHLNGTVLSISDLKDQIRKNKQYIKLTDGANLYIPEELLERLRQFFALMVSSDTQGNLKISSTALPLIDEITKLADEVVADENYWKWKEKYQSFKNIKQIKISKDFNGKLRDYQIAGVNWLHFLNDFKFGGILADDMGLGKTVQVIALLQNLNSNRSLTNPALIIVPLTVLFNWESELRRFASQIRTVKYKGQRSDRERIAKQFKEYDIILMSYGILLQDQEMLRKQQWSYLILDESQKIKNPSTKTYQAATSIPASNRLCLTGTPIENSLIDLWSQFNFLNPGMLGTLQQFETRFLKNSENNTVHKELLRQIIFPFLLRRKKEDVLKELPERTEIIQLVEMTDKQELLYKKWLKSYRTQIFNQINKNGINKSRLKILEALTYLRQLACHPAIFENSTDLYESGKITLLEEMLEEIIDEGHKVLVFSQFVRFLNLVREVVENNTWQYEYLDGRTKQRESRIKNFQENSEVKIFLISLKAGGLGLNLTAADYVIHLDPWWNPAVEQQATDRAHRIGQENRVFVYKYIVKNSVEEKILQLQNQKRVLYDETISSENGLIKQLSAEDLQHIFKSWD